MNHGAPARTSHENQNQCISGCRWSTLVLLDWGIWAKRKIYFSPKLDFNEYEILRYYALSRVDLSNNSVCILTIVLLEPHIYVFKLILECNIFLWKIIRS